MAAQQMISNSGCLTCFMVSLFVLIGSGCHGYRILLVPLPSGSHMFSQYVIGSELLRRGHDVHMILHWSTKTPSSWSESDTKEKQIIIHRYGNNKKFNIDEEASNMTLNIMTQNLGWSYLHEKFIEFNKFLAEDLFIGNDELMEKLDSLKFDVAITDSSYFVRPLCLVAHRLRVPMISYCDVLEPWLVRVPWLPSFHTPLRTSTDSFSTFYSRLKNTAWEIFLGMFTLIPPPDENILNEYRKFGDFKSLTDIISNSLIFLTTGHPVFEAVRPTTANIIEIGGLTTEPWSSTKPFLPKKYLDFIESPGDGIVSANLGTVVVSFGSMVPKYPEQLAKKLIESFTLLPQYRFIWRFTNNMNLPIPANVMIVDWLPQKELLSHSDVKLFFTHAGNNGQFEALYYGVPMLAVPLLGDQIKNAKRIVERGYGEEIDFKKFSVEECTRIIGKIIEDVSYRNRVRKASEIFRSQTETPSERAAYWIEHVIKYGADHLRPAGNDLYIWQYLCIDVFLCIEFCILAAAFASVSGIWCLYKKLSNYFSLLRHSTDKKKK